MRSYESFAKQARAKGKTCLWLIAAIAITNIGGVLLTLYGANVRALTSSVSLVLVINMVWAAVQYFKLETAAISAYNSYLDLFSYQVLRRELASQTLNRQSKKLVADYLKKCVLARM